MIRRTRARIAAATRVTAGLLRAPVRRGGWPVQEFVDGGRRHEPSAVGVDRAEYAVADEPVGGAPGYADELPCFLDGEGQPCGGLRFGAADSVDPGSRSASASGGRIVLRCRWRCGVGHAPIPGRGAPESETAAKKFLNKNTSALPNLVSRDRE